MQRAVLFASDLAARGLDFPIIDWVVQADAPEDAATYVHRVSRKARYAKGGHALLLLLPSEEQGMLEAVKARGIEIPTIKELFLQFQENNEVFVDKTVEAVLSACAVPIRLKLRSHSLSSFAFALLSTSRLALSDNVYQHKNRRHVAAVRSVDPSFIPF
jgi:superfamily II DNA/RNA helicase